MLFVLQPIRGGQARRRGESRSQVALADQSPHRALMGHYAAQGNGRQEKKQRQDDEQQQLGREPPQPFHPAEISPNWIARVTASVRFPTASLP
jgi:hypothetical protein